MCCRRRGNRAPILVVLGKKAYDKYQEHKAERQAEVRQLSNDQRTIEYGALSYAANGEILEKTGINPPSYNEVVISNRAIMPDEQKPLVNEKAGWVKVDGEMERDGRFAADEDLFYEVSNGMGRLDIGSAAAQASAVPAPVYRSKCEQRRAERNARRAERRARGGCCC